MYRQKERSIRKIFMVPEEVVEELSILTNELKDKSALLSEREKQLECLERMINERNLAMDKQVERKVEERMRTLEANLRKEYQAEVDSLKSQLKSHKSETSRLQASTRDLLNSNKQLRTQVQQLETELDTKTKLLDETKRLYQTTKERNERLNTLLQETRKIEKPEEKIVVKTKTVFIDKPSPRKEHVSTQTKPIDFLRTPLDKAFLDIVDYLLSISRSLASLASRHSIEEVIEMLDKIRSRSSLRLLDASIVTFDKVMKQAEDDRLVESFLELILGVVRFLGKQEKKKKLAEKIYNEHLCRWLELDVHQGAHLLVPSRKVGSVNEKDLRKCLLFILICLHCDMSRASTRVLIDMVAGEIEQEEFRDAFVEFNGISTLSEIGLDDADEFSLQFICILLELTRKEQIAVKLSRQLATSGSFFDLLRHIVAIHETNGDVIDQLVMSLQRLSSNKDFTSSLKQSHVFRWLESQRKDSDDSFLQQNIRSILNRLE